MKALNSAITDGRQKANLLVQTSRATFQFKTGFIGQCVRGCLTTGFASGPEGPERLFSHGAGAEWTRLVPGENTWEH